MRTSCLILLMFFLSSVVIRCSSEHKTPEEKLGEIHFPVTGKEEAQPYFKKGLLLLHSFEYEDAAENFSKARVLDPAFSMAYWGEALTYNHTLWRYQNKAKADSILKQLGTTPEERISKGKTDIEKDFIAAVNILYGPGTKAGRDRAYADHMKELYKKYPGNPEVASFYSISLLGSVEVGRNTVVYEHAAEIAKEVLSKNHDHPGALHYLIHSYDDPDHASLALNAADSYAKVAPSAGHALHMPSHIYLALGLWDKVIQSNEASWEASRQRKERKKLNHDALGYHSFHWLMYGYMQQGRSEDAIKIVEQMKQYCDSFASPRARQHMILIKSTYLAESDNWMSPVDTIEVKQDDLNIGIRAMDYFVNGMNAYSKKDEALLKKVISNMEDERLTDHKKISDHSAHSCAVVNSNVPNLLDVQYAEVMEMELKALLAWLKKDSVATENWFKKATGLENNISYSFGPPGIVKPSNELYGEWLLEMNRPQMALQQFELTLKGAPNRTISMNRKQHAASLLKEKSL